MHAARSRFAALHAWALPASLGAGTLLLASYALLSLRWRMVHDTPMMLYQAFCMERYGWAPYRDFFDMNLPGTYATYRLIGLVFGYGDLGARLADLGIVTILSLLIVALVRPLSGRAAWAGVLLFGCSYLLLGPWQALQRELIALVPICLGVLGALHDGPLWRRALLAGLGFGVAATVKPHALIGLLPVAAYFVAIGPRRALPLGVAAGLAGVSAPLLLAGGWLWARGLLPDFVHSLGYLRYYGALTGGHRALEGGARGLYILQQLTRLGGQGQWLGLGLLGALSASRSSQHSPALRQRAALLGGLLVAYLFYPAASGQFWPYHWLPMQFWGTVCAGLLVSGASRWRQRLGRGLLLLSALGLLRADRVLRHVDQAPKDGRPDAIAAWLAPRLQPGDVVQPLDWVSAGVVHGLLLAEAKPATKYLYSFHFYHHVSTPYIQALRADFLARFDAADPAYVVQGSRPNGQPWVRGPDTARRFPALERRLRRRYVVVERMPQVVLWARKDRASAPPPAP